MCFMDSTTGLGKNLVFANHILAQGMNGLDDIIETDDKFGNSLTHLILMVTVLQI